MMACIGEPISWLRLERFALGAADPAIASHVAACPACRHCLDQIRGDTVALPPLVVASPPPRRTWLRWLVPALAAAAAAAALIAVLRPRPSSDGVVRVAVKGAGEVSLELVRERAGAIRFDATSYAPGDRWKVMVSCPPSASGAPLSIAVSVDDGISVDHPLAAARIACGNRVVVPGAFTITGSRANRVCARIAAAPDGDLATACLTLAPEAHEPRREPRPEPR
ncbi:MAG: hypothetical protein E6J91_25660 [Deltaproteobacteria bacterium]|nr:MAG: hypothetical protein E6J91_25660 [Deltaproteobacteria bacterium]